MAGGRSLSTENDSHRGLALAPGLQTHGQRVAHRNSTHAFALDKTFRFIDGMTKESATDPPHTREVEKCLGPALLFMDRRPLPCHPERSRGICGVADLSWKNEILSCHKFVNSARARPIKFAGPSGLL